MSYYNQLQYYVGCGSSRCSCFGSRIGSVGGSCRWKTPQRRRGQVEQHPNTGNIGNSRSTKIQSYMLFQDRNTILGVKVTYPGLLATICYLQWSFPVFERFMSYLGVCASKISLDISEKIAFHIQGRFLFLFPLWMVSFKCLPYISAFRVTKNMGISGLPAASARENRAGMIAGMIAGAMSRTEGWEVSWV